MPDATNSTVDQASLTLRLKVKALGRCVSGLLTMLIGALGVTTAMGLALVYAVSSPLEVAKWKLQAGLFPSSLTNSFAALAETCRNDGFKLSDACAMPLAVIAGLAGMAFLIFGIVEIGFALAVWLVEKRRGKELI